jgi:very-short-patch-repair endonuclease
MLKKAPWFGPRVIREFLIMHDVGFYAEHKFRDHAEVARYPFDFYLPDLNLVIEYHGRQHKDGWMHDSKNALEIQARDHVKKEFVLREGMRFLEIDDRTKSAILKRLRAEFDDFSRQRVTPFVLKARHLSASEKESLETAFLWNEKSVEASILKCSTVKEFRQRYPSAHDYALKSGIWRELSKSLKRNKDPGKYTKEYVLSMAKECKTREEFREKFRGCWAAAQRNGWIAQACKHMPKHLQKPWLG